MFRRYLKSKSGQGMSEYLILVLLIAVGSIAAANSIGHVVYSKLDQIHSKLQDVNFTDVQASSGGGGGSSSSPRGSGNAAPSQSNNSNSGGFAGTVNQAANTARSVSSALGGLLGR